MKKLFTLLITITTLSTSVLFAQQQKQILSGKINANHPWENEVTRSVVEQRTTYMSYALKSDEGLYDITLMDAGQEYAVRFVPEVYRLFVGKDPVITGIALAVAEYTQDEIVYNNKTFTFNLYEGTTLTEEEGLVLGTKIYTSTETLTGEGTWLKVDFETPITLDITKGYFLSFKAQGKSTIGRSAVNSPDLNGLGNLTYFVDETGKEGWGYSFFGTKEAPEYYPWVVGLVCLSDIEGGTDLHNSKSIEFSVYPNPATDVVYIENAVESNLRVIDMTGKVVVERNIQSINEAVGVSQLEKGIYFVEITKDGIKNVQKLIKR